MSTVREIEAALSTLSVEELQHLDGAVQSALKEKTPARVRTASEARDWWNSADFLTTEEREAFARDIEEGRALGNRPPSDRWE